MQLLLSNLTIEHCVFRHNKADGVRPPHEFSAHATLESPPRVLFVQNRAAQFYPDRLGGTHIKSGRTIGSDGFEPEQGGAVKASGHIFIR